MRPSALVLSSGTTRSQRIDDLETLPGTQHGTGQCYPTVCLSTKRQSATLESERRRLVRCHWHDAEYLNSCRDLTRSQVLALTNPLIFSPHI